MHSGADSVEEAVKRAKEEFGAKAVWVYELGVGIKFGCEYFVKKGEIPPQGIPYFYDNGSFNGKLLHREIF